MLQLVATAERGRDNWQGKKAQHYPHVANPLPIPIRHHPAGTVTRVIVGGNSNLRQLNGHGGLWLVLYSYPPVARLSPPRCWRLCGSLPEMVEAAAEVLA